MQDMNDGVNIGWSAADVRHKAEKELADEQFDREVEEYKEKMRAAKWWHGIFPWRITITRRET